MTISITGPSGAGKNFLKLALLEKFPFMRELCWTTTRPLRKDEVQGKHRENIAEADFKKLASAGELLLTQHLFGNSYGIRKDYLFREDGWSITELHIENLVRATSQQFPLISIGLVPIDIGYLKTRLLRRGTEKHAELRERLASAEAEARKMHRKKHLFSLLVQFDATNENTVVDRVVSFLEPKISK